MTNKEDPQSPLLQSPLFESSSFAFCWQNQCKEFLAELFINSVWTENKHYHHLTSKLIVLSLLSTTIGPEHKPLLWLGVVLPWQSKFGTQCGTYGRWTGPFSHQCHHKLFHTIASQPVVVKLYQLAYVSCLPANPKSHTKIDFFSGKNTTKCTTFSKQPTGWHQMVHDAITNFANPNYCVLEEDSVQIPFWDIVVSGKAIHSIPQGTDESKRPSQDRWGRIQPIPRTPEEGCDFRHHSCWFENLCRELCSHGEHMWTFLWCQGHRTLAVPGAQNFCGAQGHRIFIVPGAQVDHIATTAVWDPVRLPKFF